MIARIYSSIRFRVAFAYRQRMLREYRAKVLEFSELSAPAKPQATFELLSIGGVKQLDLMRYSFWSMAQSWSALPALHLVSDGSLEPSDMLKAMAWWPRPVRVERWEAIAERQADLGRIGLHKLAQTNMLARKACAIFDAATNGPTLFCDTDLLWFRGPPPLPADGLNDAITSLPGPANGSNLAIKMAPDLTACYDADLLRHAGDDAFLATPFLNSGVCYVRGDIYTAAGIDRLIDYAVAHPQYFTEQTLLAYACKKLGGDCFSPDEILLKTDDATTRRPGQSYMHSAFARHYVGDVRHWFWRDALTLLQAAKEKTAVAK